MDEHRFDSLTRMLAGGLRRRVALKTLAGVALTGVATSTSASRVAADNGELVGDFCDKKHPCKKPLVCVSHECAEEDKNAKCQGKGCKKKKGKKHKGGGSIHDPAQ